MTRRDFLQASTAASGLLGPRPGTILLLSVATGKLLAADHPETAARALARPGSTIKPFTLAAALAKGPLGPYPCPRRLQIRDRVLDCSHSPTPHPLTAPEALALSCNNFVARAAQSLTAIELTEALQRAGLTARPNLLPNEATPHLQLPADLPGRQLLALGEDGILVTPLSLANAYRRLAQQAPQEIKEGLRAAIQYGTAQLAETPKTQLAGKTGTAMAPDRSHRQAWFAGYFPANAPEIVVVVFLPQGSGGGDAAPIARQAVEAWLIKHAI